MYESTNIVLLISTIRFLFGFSFSDSLAMSVDLFLG
jgi:hypothetical protein